MEQLKNRLLILITGLSGSGKTTTAKNISKRITESGYSCNIISMDNFYKGGPQDNYDVLDAFNLDKLTSSVDKLLSGKTISYNFYSHMHSQHTSALIINEPSDVVIVEGILCANVPYLVNRAEMIIYVDTPVETCFERRLIRDISAWRNIHTSKLLDVEKAEEEEKRKILRMYYDIVIPCAKKYHDQLEDEKLIKIPNNEPNDTDINSEAIKNMLLARLR